jgi:hypothetical protein
MAGHAWLVAVLRSSLLIADLKAHNLSTGKASN